MVGPPPLNASTESASGNAAVEKFGRTVVTFGVTFALAISLASIALS